MLQHFVTNQNNTFFKKFLNFLQDLLLEQLQNSNRHDKLHPSNTVVSSSALDLWLLPIPSSKCVLCSMVRFPFHSQYHTWYLLQGLVLHDSSVPWLRN